MTSQRQRIEPDASPNGAFIRRVTRSAYTHHAPFFIVPAYDDAMQGLVYVAYESGTPQIFVEDRKTGEHRQLTHRSDLIPWSIHPSRDGAYVYYTAGRAGYRINISNLQEDELVAFPEANAQGEGMVAAGMGTTALSACGRYWALKLQDGSGASLILIDTITGEEKRIVHTDVIAHMQFHPEDSNLLYFAGNFKERLWTVRTDGTELRQHYERSPSEWITHESWIPGRNELMFVEWPHRVRAIHIETGHIRDLVHTNAWHPSASRDGKWIVADTNAPDVGIIRFPADGSGEFEWVCASNASNEGSHWWGPFPYEDGPISVQARQHTHPHPTYSPDGRFILFASDASGESQLYEVDLMAWRADGLDHAGAGGT